MYARVVEERILDSVNVSLADTFYLIEGTLSDENRRNHPENFGDHRRQQHIRRHIRKNAAEQMDGMCSLHTVSWIKCT